jgi:hypothetical protein
VCLKDGTDDEEQCSHTSSGDEEGVPATKSFDEEEHEESGCDDFNNTIDA